MTGSSPKAPIQTTAGGSCPVPLQNSVSASQPPSPGQRGHCGEHRQPPGGAALSRLGEQRGKLLQPRGAQLRWVLPRVKGVRPLGVFLYLPDPGSQAPVPRGEAPHRHCASDRSGLQAAGSSAACGPGSPAHRHQSGPQDRRARQLRWAARGAWARRAVEGSAEAGTPGRAGAELIKARRRAQGKSRRVAVRPSSACERAALSSAPGGLTPQRARAPAVGTRGRGRPGSRSEDEAHGRS